MSVSFERFMLSKLSDRNEFVEETFAGPVAADGNAPIADLHSTRAWGMPLDYRLSYASLPGAGYTRPNFDYSERGTMTLLRPDAADRQSSAQIA